MSLDIKLIGPVADQTSWGSNLRDLAIALSDIGINVSISNIDFPGAPKAKLNNQLVARIQSMMQVNPQEGHVAILMVAPERLVFIDEKAKANIAWTAFDTEKPSFISKILMASDKVKEIWFPTLQHRSNAIKHFVGESKVDFVSFGVDSMSWSPMAQRLEQFPEEDFYFGFVGTLSPANGFDIAINAFYEEFRNEPKAKLILKPSVGNIPQDKEVEYIKNVISQVKKDGALCEVLYIADHQTEDDLKRIFKTIDCLVAPIRIKSWASNMIKCMSVGTPVITTASGYHTAFANSENSLLVSAKSEQIRDVNWLLNNPIQQEHSWYSPNFQEVKKQMRVAFNDKAALVDLGKKARQSVIKLDWRNVAMNVMTKLQKYSK
jgi:glycosyltransferase involved in cell wall biosynthesis